MARTAIRSRVDTLSRSHQVQLAAQRRVQRFSRHRLAVRTSGRLLSRRVLTPTGRAAAPLAILVSFDQPSFRSLLFQGT